MIIDYQTFARFLWVSKHPFIRFSEATMGEQAEYERTARRILEGPGKYDNRLISVHDYIKSTPAEERNKGVGK